MILVSLFICECDIQQRVFLGTWDPCDTPVGEKKNYLETEYTVLPLV